MIKLIIIIHNKIYYHLCTKVILPRYHGSLQISKNYKRNIMILYHGYIIIYKVKKRIILRINNPAIADIKKNYCKVII